MSQRALLAVYGERWCLLFFVKGSEENKHRLNKLLFIELYKSLFWTNRMQNESARLESNKNRNKEPTITTIWEHSWIYGHKTSHCHCWTVWESVAYFLFYSCCLYCRKWWVTAETPQRRSLLRWWLDLKSSTKKIETPWNSRCCASHGRHSCIGCSCRSENSSPALPTPSSQGARRSHCIHSDTSQKRLRKEEDGIRSICPNKIKKHNPPRMTHLSCSQSCWGARRRCVARGGPAMTATSSSHCWYTCGGCARTCPSGWRSVTGSTWAWWKRRWRSGCRPSPWSAAFCSWPAWNLCGSEVIGCVRCRGGKDMKSETTDVWRWCEPWFPLEVGRKGTLNNFHLLIKTLVLLWKNPWKNPCYFCFLMHLIWPIFLSPAVILLLIEKQLFDLYEGSQCISLVKTDAA